MKKLLALLLAALMVLSLAACSMEGGSSEPAKTEETTAAPETTETETEQPAEETAAPEVKADADITIAVVPKSLDNAIFLDSQAAAEAKAKELGISETQECYGFADEKDKVMQLAAMQGYVTRKQVEDALQVKTTKAYMLLQELCDAGRLAPIGVGRSRKYISR